MTDTRIATKAVFDSTTGTYFKPGETVTLTEDMAVEKTRAGRKIVPGFDEKSAVAKETRVAGDKKSAVDAALKAAGQPKKKAAAKKKAPAKAKVETGDDNTVVEEGGTARSAGGDKTNPLS